MSLPVLLPVPHVMRQWLFYTTQASLACTPLMRKSPLILFEGGALVIQ